MNENRISFDKSVEEAQKDAMFVWSGFLHAKPWFPGDGERYQGLVNAASFVTRGTRILRLALAKWLRDHVVEEYPGTFEYEVCEPFGAWLRKTGPEVEDKAIRREAKLRILAFFKQVEVKAVGR